jgi:type I restriction enzyme S subunit
MSAGIRAGYKQTEVGVIPEDWETPSIIDVAPKIVDYRGRTPRKLGMDWGGGEIAALSARNVKMGFIDFGEECNLGSEALYRRWMTNGDTERGDIVFTTEAPLGNVALIPDDKQYILSQRTILLKTDPARAFSPFVFQLMLSDGFQELLAQNASGSTAQGIQRKKFETLRVACPPISEQRAIAAALSDVDALLAGLDRLIAKKRDLKQAAMQQLLTGQTRLPGFQGEWVVKLLPDLADIRSGGTPSTNDAAAWDGDIAWCTPTDITSLAGDKYLAKTARLITAHGLKQSSAEVIPAGSVVMTSRATIGECAINTIPMTTNQGFKNFVPFESVDAEFLYYLLTTQKAGFISLCGGSTFLEIGKAQLRSYGVRVPSGKAEQTAIAAVLSDMDAELTALEARRDKTRALKQAMMQELLTGKTRLV